MKKTVFNRGLSLILALLISFVFVKYPPLKPMNVYATSSIAQAILNDTSLGFSESKKRTLASVADSMINAGFEPAFVAGALGNIALEGSFGWFEGTTSSGHTDYMQYMTRHYQYYQKYSYNYIYNCNFTETYNMEKELYAMKYTNSETGRCGFGIGCCQWTFGRTHCLFKKYKEIAGNSNTITYEQVMLAECLTMLEELNGDCPVEEHNFHFVYTNWKSANSGNLASSDAAKSAGQIFCTQYERPSDYLTKQYPRGKMAAKIYKLCKGTNPQPKITWKTVNENYSVSTNKLNFRTSYTTSAPLVQNNLYLNKGDIVYVKETAVCHDGRTWAHITFKGKDGYCCMKDGSEVYLDKNITPDKPSISINPGTSKKNTAISWNKCGNTDHYEVYVYNSSGSRVKADTNVKSTSISYGLGAGKYSAEVVAKSSTGSSASSGRQNFTVGTITPGKPTVSVNAGTSDTNTNFTWNSCSDANEYTIKIYKSSDNSVYKTATTSGTSYSIKLPDGKYYVIVTSKYTTDGTTKDSSSSAFTVKAIPGKPTLTVTAGNNTTATKFIWNSCRNADKYQLDIYSSNGKIYKSVTQTGTSFSLTISDPGNYYAIVTAINSVYDTKTASEKSGGKFTVKAVPSKPNVNVLAGNNFTETVISWNNCDYTNSYKIVITNTDTNKQVESKILTGTRYSIKLSTAGNYKVIITAQNTTYNTSAASDAIAFNVKDVTVQNFKLNVSGISDTVVILNWTEAKNANKYEIYRNANGKYELVGETSGLSFEDAGLYIGTSYEYYVKASNEWSSKESEKVKTETLMLDLNGNGTKENPYLITSADDLLEFSELVNDSTTTAIFGKSYYQQTADIDLSGLKWTPVGTQNTPFNGHYNGNYCVITGLNISTDAVYSGFFGYCGSAVIENVSVHGTVASTANAVGGIVGEIGYSGRIENCAFYGNVSGVNYVGGIVGNLENGGTLIRCYQMGSVNGTSAVGGIAGQAKTGKNNNSQNISLSYCYHAGGNVSGSGIVGKHDIGTTKSCRITYNDCYYLKTNASTAANGSTDAGIVAVNETVLKNLIETLGEPYTDGGAENNNYPVFKWESSIYNFDGQGTLSSPYQIGSADDLLKLSEYVSDKYLNKKFGNASYVQTADIDLSGGEFISIGMSGSPFNGTYNGGYHTITGLNVSGENGGLFGTAKTIQIKNIIVYGSVSGSNAAGGLVGYAGENAELTQCAFYGDVNGNVAGGIIGKLDISGRIIDCYQSGEVSGTTSGGLIGTFECDEKASEESLAMLSSYHGNGSVKSGAIGLVTGNTNAVYAENVYYLKTSASNAGYGTAVNQTVLTALAETLESPFVKNADTSLNSGYPVFSWQISRYEFEGDGTAENPYIIESAEDLTAMQEYVNDPNYNATYGSAHYRQVVDIDLGDMDWTAIGMSEDCPFTGVYDGDYFTVYGLNASGETYSGLFGQVGANSQGRDAGVYNVIIKYGTSCSAKGVTGGTAAVLMNGAGVDSCGVIGDLTGDTGVGGVVGVVRRSASITNSYHNGSLSGNSKVGGILGTVESGTVIIENCYNTGGTVDGNSHVGAVIGYVGGAAKVENSYYLDNVDIAVDNGGFTGIVKVNTLVMKALAPTLGDAYTDNIFEDFYNDGYPIFAAQFPDVEKTGSYPPGDVNDDGVFDISDVVLLQKWLLAMPDIELINWKAADLCEDDRLDVFDLCLMKRALVEQQ